MGDDNRMRIVNILMEEELCVCEIETILNITQSNASRHLNKLKSVNIISSSKEAQWVHYQVSQRFKEENRNLLQYLEIVFQKNHRWEIDVVRLKKYKRSPYNCEHIRANKDRVMQYLEQGKEGFIYE